MRPFGGRSGGRLARLSAFAVLTLALVLSGAGTASAVSISHDSNVAAGNNGTLKVHEKDTSTGTESNDPKVCIFNLEGFNFDPGQDLVLAFQVQGGDEPTGQVPTPNAFNVQADNEGYFASSYFNDGAGSPTILAGHYKVVAYGKDTGTGQFTDEKAKSKVFKVSCGAPATPTGTLTVKKALAEGSAPAGDQKFEINVTCERADYNKTFHLAVGQSATTDPLAAGTSCMVSEDAKDGWAPTITPSQPVTVQKDTTVTVTVSNFKKPHEHQKATITVTKALAAGSGSAGNLTFPITVSCQNPKYSKTFELVVGASGTTKPLPAGAECTITETVPSGWDTPAYSPASTVTVNEGGTVVTVYNHRTVTPPPQPVQTVSLGLVKANSPTVDQLVQAGSTITYALTATAGGTLAQANVVVSDVVPTGTTYVSGSAACVGWTPCTVTEPTVAPKTVMWALGTMVPGNSATVTFKVTVNSGLNAGTVITNVGTVASSLTSAVSNEVTNKLTEVKGEVIVGPTTPTVTPAAVEGETLPATGESVPVGYLVGTGVGLVALGALLTALSRRRRDSA